MSATVAKRQARPKAKSKSVADEAPPRADDDESLLLGSLLLNPNEFVPLVMALVGKEDFFDPLKGEIFAEIRGVHQQPEAHDVDWIAKRLVARGVADNVDEIARVIKVLKHETVPTAVHAPHFARKVKEAAASRKLLGVRDDLATRVLNCERPSDVIKAITDRLADIGSELDPTNDGRPRYERLTSAQLLDMECRVNYLVDDVVPEGEGGIISGRFKTLKTGVSCDLVVSLATGTPFLGRFNVQSARRVGMMSAEARHPVLKARAIAVAQAREIDLRDVTGAIWSTSCPKIGNQVHHEALERFIVENELGLLIVDPSYLALSEAGDSVNNVYKMGALLLPITELIARTGCSIILCNHNRKERNGREQFSPPELSEISMAGFAEWARFWLLLGPRMEWDEHRGEHWLWLRTGGSSGHAGLHHLNVFEGKTTDPGGRRWSVDIVQAEAGRQQETDRREAAAANRRNEEQDADRLAILQFLAKHPGGETYSTVRDLAGPTAVRAKRAIASLVDSGDIEPVDVIKGNNRHYEGYKLKAER